MYSLGEKIKQRLTKMLDDKSTIDLDKTTQDIMGAVRKKDTVW
jgi:hypothetical protein